MVSKNLGIKMGSLYKYIYDNGRKYGIQGSVICNGGNELEVLN